MENDPTKLGKCCVCEIAGIAVRNIVTLDVRVPAGEKPGGWGCVVCDLEPFGAIAVLCDDCVDKSALKREAIKFACLGFPGENRRIEIEKLTETWEHVAAKHPEIWAQNN